MTFFGVRHKRGFHRLGTAMTENLLICRILFFAALAASMAVALPVQSQAPCDFKGIAVGDKMTREQLMQRLGIVNFKLDPPRPDFMEMHEQIEQYGITGAAEREDDKIGPYCREDYCNIPWGLHVGDDNIGVKLFVSLRKDTHPIRLAQGVLSMFLICSLGAGILRRS